VNVVEEIGFFLTGPFFKKFSVISDLWLSTCRWWRDQNCSMRVITLPN
jgi:hypothetical protein